MIPLIPDFMDDASHPCDAKSPHVQSINLMFSDDIGHKPCTVFYKNVNHKETVINLYF